MADLSITAANVKQGANASVIQGTAGNALTAGEPVYQSSANTYSNTSVSESASGVVGVALNGASSSQPVDVLVFGDMDLGATLVIGTIYILGNSAKIRPFADTQATQYVSIVGIATATDKLNVNPNASGVQTQ